MMILPVDLIAEGDASIVGFNIWMINTEGMGLTHVGMYTIITIPAIKDKAFCKLLFMFDMDMY